MRLPGWQSSIFNAQECSFKTKHLSCTSQWSFVSQIFLMALIFGTRLLWMRIASELSIYPCGKGLSVAIAFSILGLEFNQGILHSRLVASI